MPLGTDSARARADSDFPFASLSPTLSTDLEGPHLVIVSSKSSVPLWSYPGIFRWLEGIRRLGCRNSAEGLISVENTAGC